MLSPRRESLKLGIVENTGISIPTTQLWPEKICDTGTDPCLTHKKRFGKKMLLSKRTLNGIKKQIECRWTPTAKELKQKENSALMMWQCLHFEITCTKCSSTADVMVFSNPG